MSEGSCCKISRVVTERGLTAPRRYTGDLDDYLVAKWVGAGQHEAIGVRSLVEWFNKRLLRTVYRQHNRSDTETRITAEYEALQGDGVENYQREEVLADLEADGIDGDDVTADFISKSTLSRHLKDCLEAEKERKPSQRNWERDQIEFATDSFQDNIESALQSLGNKGRIADIEAATVETPVLLSCPDCPTRVTLETALEQGVVCSTHGGQPTSQQREQPSR
jgi:DNA-binding transcriptional ArsR family regulator